ncbi:MAG: di-trans,poly-cis-decaprenylcistransferase [Gammaproteobacteria bacterium]|nr:MAG: di-trans,poly-cis-decaprenylcistransferase [Gammaproteobacteria bacterium]
MDGNGRWAKQQGKSRAYGHRAGHTAVLKIVRHAAGIGVKSLTLYAFSSENWLRPESEVKALMMLFQQAIKRNRRLFIKHKIRFNVIGDTSRFSDKLQQAIAKLEDETADHKTMTLNIAANYGSKWDIVRAARHLAQQVEDQRIAVADIDEALFARHLVLAEQPPVDLLVRTGGEQRISNYLLWQCAYAEFYFTPVFWPEFDEQALDAAIAEFQQRTRRFGGL